jgi:hypothetical protein
MAGKKPELINEMIKWKHVKRRQDKLEVYGQNKQKTDRQQIFRNDFRKYWRLQE